MLASSLFLQEACQQLSPQLTTHKEIQPLILNYQQVFVEPKHLPPNRTYDHDITLQPNSKPISIRPYQYPFYQKTENEKMVQQLLTSRLICPSQSPFSSLVLLVKKFDGSWRFYVDCRALNEIMIKDKFPILVIDKILDELHSSRFYLKIDLRSGYYQIRVQKEDIHKTAFHTHEGHYEFILMPFRLTNVSSTFQVLMNEIFHPYLQKLILVFFNDILIYSKTWIEHLKHLEQTLQILEEHQLFAESNKCQFRVRKVDYLGHIISENGVAVDPWKIQVVLDWPEPKTQRGV